MVYHSPGSPSMYYPASPTPSSVINYSPPPWRNRRWQGASCSVKYRAQACCIGGTMGEGGFPSPIWWKYTGHAGEINESASLSALLPVPDTPLRGSSTVPRRLGRPYYGYVAPRQEPWFTNTVSHYFPSHAASVYGLPSTQAPYPPRTPCTVPKNVAFPGRNYPLLPSITHTLSPTAFPTPGMGRIAFQLSSWRWYSGPPYRKALLGCWTPPVSISGPKTQPCRHPRRRGHCGACPLVRSRYVCPLSTPLTQQNVSQPHQPPRWRWWGTEGPLRHPPEALERRPIVPPPPTPPSQLSSVRPSMSGGAGKLEAPRRRPPVFPGIWTCPRRHTPCAGP